MTSKNSLFDCFLTKKHNVGPNDFAIIEKQINTIELNAIQLFISFLALKIKHSNKEKIFFKHLILKELTCAPCAHATHSIVD